MLKEGGDELPFIKVNEITKFLKFQQHQECMEIHMLMMIICSTIIYSLSFQFIL